MMDMVSAAADYPRLSWDIKSQGVSHKLTLWREDNHYRRNLVGSCVVTETKNPILASNCVLQGRRELANFNIKPAYRGQGYASKMLAYVIEKLRPEYLFIGASISNPGLSNPQLQAFYARHGFKVMTHELEMASTNNPSPVFMIYEGNNMGILDKLKNTRHDTSKPNTTTASKASKADKSMVISEDDLMKSLYAITASFKPRTPNSAYKDKLAKLGPNALKREIKTLATALAKATTKLRIARRDMMDRSKDSIVKELEKLCDSTRKALALARSTLSAKLDAKGKKK